MLHKTDELRKKSMYFLFVFVFFFFFFKPARRKREEDILQSRGWFNVFAHTYPYRLISHPISSASLLVLFDLLDLFDLRETQMPLDANSCLKKKRQRNKSALWVKFRKYIPSTLSVSLSSVSNQCDNQNGPCSRETPWMPACFLPPESTNIANQIQMGSGVLKGIHV